MSLPLGDSGTRDSRSDSNCSERFRANSRSSRCCSFLTRHARGNGSANAGASAIDGASSTGGGAGCVHSASIVSSSSGASGSASIDVERWALGVLSSPVGMSYLRSYVHVGWSSSKTSEKEITFVLLYTPRARQTARWTSATYNRTRCTSVRPWLSPACRPVIDGAFPGSDQAAPLPRAPSPNHTQLARDEQRISSTPIARGLG